MSSTALVWFRNDLRLDDHEPLARALENHEKVGCIYCFDPRQFSETSYGFPKTGPFRARFIRESVDNLRARLRARGGDLIVRRGKPEDVLPELAKECSATTVYYHEEAAREELDVEDAVRDALAQHGAELHGAWGHTLVHRDDLPFHPGDMPDVYTEFRKAVERDWEIRPLFPEPEEITAPPIDSGEIPALNDLGLENPEEDQRAVLDFKGGEDTARARLRQYIWDHDCLREYKETRNGLLGPDFSSKFSAWLAAGCVSPRRIHDEVRRYESERVKNKSTYWMIFELLWRDNFRFLMLKYGDRMFARHGLGQPKHQESEDQKNLRLWIEGRTGYPFVDANMREIAATGYMSNRGRQNVASFLVRELGVHWRMGAEYFESQLIDYDVCSNWGNWLYVSGHGTDPREDRWFNTVKQGQRYDPNGDYVRHWLPELKDIPDTLIHEPWKDQAALNRSGYCKRVVRP